MRVPLAFAACAGLLVTLPGCVHLFKFQPRGGLFYQHITEPLDTDFDATPAHLDGRRASGTVMHLEYRNVRVMWSSNATGDTMRRERIEPAAYADLETFSLGGIWNMHTVHVYGPQKDESAPDDQD